MLNVLITLFSSYGIFDLATALGVRFLDKFESVIDYRFTRHILELIWVAVDIVLHIYCNKKKLH